MTQVLYQLRTCLENRYLCRNQSQEKTQGMKRFRSLFESSLTTLRDACHDGDCRSYSYRRLQILEAKFNLHKLDYQELEQKEQREILYRDFYNVIKVDNHIHHSASMTQQHLLRFILNKVKTEPLTKVWQDPDTSEIFTLRDLFRKKLQIDPLTLTMDTLDMRAHNTFHRFDKWNTKYNPMNQNVLRDIFLKYDNYVNGRYLGELTQEVFQDLRAAKFVFAEYRISIYGKSKTEWNILAAWLDRFHLYDEKVKWFIQIPRLYRVLKQQCKIINFQEMLNNIFDPLMDEKNNPQLQKLLSNLGGFDCVDDESASESVYSEKLPSPEFYDWDTDPCYAYFILHVYHRIQQVNRLRQSFGKNTFAFHPHSGEAGDLEHLMVSFLLADGINHGVMLTKNPALQYLFYLAQIPVSVSPLSNNLLFIPYAKNPFPKFHARGLCVTLSTDDPLLIHMTNQSLLEEYSVAAQVWKLSNVDLCEIARNSVLQSTLAITHKDISKEKTNVPETRLRYRDKVLQIEKCLLSARSKL